MCLNQTCVDVSTVAGTFCGYCSKRGVSHVTTLLYQIISVSQRNRAMIRLWSALCVNLLCPPVCQRESSERRLIIEQNNETDIYGLLISIGNTNRNIHVKVIDVKTFLRFLFLSRFLRFLTFFLFCQRFLFLKNVHWKFYQEVREALLKPQKRINRPIFYYCFIMKWLGAKQLGIHYVQSILH